MRGTETLSVVVLPAEVADRAAELELFGWRLLGADPSDPNRTILTFSRRRDLPQLERLRELEAEYFSLAAPPPPPRLPRPLWLSLPALALLVGIPWWIYHQRCVYRPGLERARNGAVRSVATKRRLLGEAAALSRESVSTVRRVSRERGAV